MVNEEERKKAIENARKRVEEAWEGWFTKFAHLTETEKDEKKKKVYAQILNTAVQRREEMIIKIEGKIRQGTPYEKLLENTTEETKKEQSSLEDKIDELGEKLEKKIDSTSHPKHKYIIPLLISIIAGLIIWGVSSFFG